MGNPKSGSAPSRITGAALQRSSIAGGDGAPGNGIPITMEELEDCAPSPGLLHAGLDGSLGGRA